MASETGNEAKASLEPMLGPENKTPLQILLEEQEAKRAAAAAAAAVPPELPAVPLSASGDPAIIPALGRAVSSAVAPIGPSLGGGFYDVVSPIGNKLFGNQAFPLPEGTMSPIRSSPTAVPIQDDRLRMGVFPMPQLYNSQQPAITPEETVRSILQRSGQLPQRAQGLTFPSVPTPGPFGLPPMNSELDSLRQAIKARGVSDANFNLFIQEARRDPASKQMQAVDVLRKQIRASSAGQVSPSGFEPDPETGALVPSSLLRTRQNLFSPVP